MTKPAKSPRVRLSLETTVAVKSEITSHMQELGTWSLIKCIRESVRVSRIIWAARQRGTLLLEVETNGEVQFEEVDL